MIRLTSGPVRSEHEGREPMDAHDPVPLGAYSLGLLGPEESRALERHLRWCAECRGELRRFEEVRELLGTVPPEELHDA